MTKLKADSEMWNQIRLEIESNITGVKNKSLKKSKTTEYFELKYLHEIDT